MSSGENDGRTDRWQHLVSGAFLLDEVRSPVERQRVLQYLDTVLEVFPGAIDPVEDFEGFSVRRMALALRRALET
jgi:hypothetical protein